MTTHDESRSHLDGLVDRLPRAFEPGRDLWPGIEARIRAPRGRARGWDLALAAAVAALTVSVLFVGLGYFEPRPSTAPGWAYQQLDSAYQPLRATSLERYRANADRLDPELRATVESNLAIIDRALTEIRVALASRPSDAALSQMLQRTYEQELAIIDAVTPPRMTVPEPVRYRGML
jgi:hypothetical protein